MTKKFAVFNPVLFFLFLATFSSSSFPAGENAIPHSRAPADSSFIAAYLSQPEDTLESCRKSAEEISDGARKSTHGPQRKDLLARAAAQDPARTRYWLDLAETEMEMGYFEEAEASLASARATIDFLSGKDRKEAIRNYSVGKSWFHFEMGNWEDGLQWAEQAVKYKAGIEGYLLAGLNSAYSSKSFEELRKTTSGLRPLSQGGNRRQNLSWCYLLHFYFHDYLFDGTDAAVWLRKTTHHYQKDVSRWRDYGIYCEANQSAKLAVEYYSKSHRALRFKDGGWLTGMEHPIPPDRASPTVMPFWINADQEFVTGSLLAYMSYFQLQMATAESHAARHDLAARILTYANRTYRRYPDYPWVPLWLSEALLVLGQPLEAENTIEKARASFEALEITEPHLDRVHGHILLLRKNAGRAEPMVRRAVSRFPADGACWTDLGLVEVMSGNRTAAREAFDKALELDPGLVTAWYNRGLMNMHEGLFEEAVSDIERANNLDPDDAEITGLLEQLKRILSR